MTKDTMKRKLAAILSADVVGYSRLMGDDEGWTIRTLTTPLSLDDHPILGIAVVAHEK